MLYASCKGEFRLATYSFAKTPLKAAHAPLEMARRSHADFFCGGAIGNLGLDLVGDCIHGQ